MKVKSVSAVIIITLLMLIPSVIALETNEAKIKGNITINIPDAISAPSILVDVGNQGFETVENIAVTGQVQGIFGICILGNTFSDSIASIAPGETVTLQTPVQIGIGLMKYTATASWDNESVETERNYILIGFLIFTLG